MKTILTSLIAFTFFSGRCGLRDGDLDICDLKASVRTRGKICGRWVDITAFTFSGKVSWSCFSEWFSFFDVCSEWTDIVLTELQETMHSVLSLSYHSTAGELRAAHYQFPLLQRCPADHVPREYLQYLPVQVIYGCSVRSIHTSISKRNRLCFILL